MSFRVDGVALVTGAASGIGREAAFCFAEAGASAVIFADLHEAGATEASEKSKAFALNPAYKTLVLKVDVTDEGSVEQMVATTVQTFGRIDYAVNSAGIDVQDYKPFQETDIKDYEKVMNVNVTGALLTSKAIIKVMQGQEPRSIQTRTGTRDIGRGSIVNVASATSYAAVPAKAGYVASKHALLALTKSAALDNASANIRVNAVCPTWVRTAMFDEESKKVPPMADLIKAAVPLGRPAEPDEVAEVILFLSSPSASYVTGTGLIIDAGMTLTFHLS